MNGYAAFLEGKRRVVPNLGVEVDESELHESLFPFQRAITRWALRKGRAAIFADTGLGKTRMQLEWARLSAARTLIVAPLSVARQTVREAASIGHHVGYVRRQDDVPAGPGEWITNYELAHHFDPSLFDAVVLDESSILKNVDGATRRTLTKQWATVQHRLACSATPAPNDVTELCNHADFLGAMNRPEMLAHFFVNDEFHGRTRWRLKGHAHEAFYEWMAGWATAVRYPSDLGFDDDGYRLPPLNIHAELVPVAIEPEDGRLFAELGGVGSRAKVRRQTTDARVARAAELANGTQDQWIIWCGLNGEADGAAKAIDGAVNVHGSLDPETKAELLEAFQDGEIRVLVTKPSIAGFGMNFQNAHRMAFVGLSDSYEAYYQAIRRCYRFGQTHPVDAHVVVSELEQQIVDNVTRKESETSTFTAGIIRHSEVHNDDRIPAALHH